MYRVATMMLSALVLSGLAAPAFAACPAIFPPLDFHVMPDDDVQAFVTYSEPLRIQTLVVQPTFSGTATEFGMVIPIPAWPEINEAPEDMFEELWEYTGFQEHVAMIATIEESTLLGESSVVVLEQKAVGDFETTLLTAGDAGDLVDWLNSHDFQFVGEDKANFDYYVQKGGYYFVAMRVNMDEADVGADGMINGKLRPIEFVFKSEQPMLPFRIMAHDMDQMSFTLYTLGEIPYYIPGVKVTFADRVQDWRGELESLERYHPADRWLLKMHVDFDPRAIEGSLILQRFHDIGDWIPMHLPDIVINPHMSLPGSGIVVPFHLLEMDRERMAGIVEAISDAKSLDSECDDTTQAMLRQDGSGPVCVDEPAVSQYAQRGWVEIEALAGMDPWKRALALDGILLTPSLAYSATPFEQVLLGIPPENIECKDDMQLMIRPSGGSACIMESSVDGLAERGWTKSTMAADELRRLS